MIEVNNCTKTRINSFHLRRVASYILLKEGKKGVGLSIAIVGQIRSRDLNLRYRKKNKPASVLSFQEPEFGAGEIVICPEEVRNTAKKYGILFEQAMTWMVIHGVLHLLGYTHSKKAMQEKETAYLSHFK